MWEFLGNSVSHVALNTRRFRTKGCRTKGCRRDRSAKGFFLSFSFFLLKKTHCGIPGDVYPLERIHLFFIIVIILHV
jgi:hypothetical protein